MESTGATTATATTTGGDNVTSAATATATPTSSCKLLNALITDEIFNKSNCCLIIDQNCLSYNNYGRCADAVAKYNYGDVAGLRHPNPIMKSFSTFDDWGIEGDTILKNPPPHIEGPTIATLITQFGIGRQFEENFTSKNIVKYCKDMVVSSRLSDDTLKKRIFLFNKSVFRLGSLLSSSNYDHIKKIIFPLGISHGDKVDDIWLSQYLPVIYAFASDMEKQGKGVFLLMNGYHLTEINANYENRNDRFTEMFRKLKSHPFVDKVTFLYYEPLSSYRDNEGYDVPDTQTYYNLPQFRM